MHNNIFHRHSWTAWEQFSKEMQATKTHVFTGIDLTTEYYTYNGVKRWCTKCGEQEEKVWEKILH